MDANLDAATSLFSSSDIFAPLCSMPSSLFTTWFCALAWYLLAWKNQAECETVGS